MKEMAVRALSGAVYVALIVICLIAPQWLAPDGFLSFNAMIPVYALGALFGVLGLCEFHNMMSARTPLNIAALAVDIAFAVLAILGGITAFTTTLVAYGVVRVIMAISSRSESAATSLSVSLLGMLYIVAPLCIGISLYASSGSAMLSSHFAIAMFIAIWANDTGAYLVGKSIGRHKMCPRLSPKKTWEGFAGGVVTSVAALFIYMWCADIFTEGGRMLMCAIFGVAISVAATYGDLLESMLKRRLGVKDSGRLIPGHGGILDRIDSLLFVLPTVYVIGSIILLLSGSGII